MLEKVAADVRLKGVLWPTLEIEQPIRGRCQPVIVCDTDLFLNVPNISRSAYLSVNWPADLKTIALELQYMEKFRRLTPKMFRQVHSALFSAAMERFRELPGLNNQISLSRGTRSTEQRSQGICPTSL